MNYIRTLQKQVTDLQRKLFIQERAFNDFRCFLHGPKFAGQDLDGERKDWIATGDVLNWLREVESFMANSAYADLYEFDFASPINRCPKEVA